MACKYKYNNNWYSEEEVKKEITKNISKDDLVLSLLQNYSYTIEINAATKVENKPEYEYNEFGESFQTGESLVESKADFYSNLTVPGGTNYTENEISTPLITPSIKGHAQFATPNGIGWFRSDDKTGGLQYTYTKEELEDFLPERFNVGEEQIRYVPSENKWYSDAIRSFLTDEQVTSKYLQTLPQKEATKTRRILEVQSDWGQKQRKSKEPDINIKYDIQQIINDLQKSGDLKIDCN